MKALFWLQDFLSGKKTIITAVFTAVLNILVAAEVISVDNMNEINAALLALMGWFLRLGIKKV